jgi:hypothetical protein
VPQKPQRPFVPHRTPTTPRPAIRTSEFRLSPPFVPGKSQPIGDAEVRGSAPVITESEVTGGISLRSIEDFLDASPTEVTAYAQEIRSSTETTAYAQERRDDPYENEFDDEPDELPPVEHFIDELPVVDHFAPESEGAMRTNGGGVSDAFDPGSAHSPEPSESGWLDTDWQHYDWRAAAALGETANVEASNAWATTDWGGTAPKAGDLRPTAAHAFASALDEIAKRIREGDLSVPGGSLTDPATIAATLAALLGVKR